MKNQYFGDVSDYFKYGMLRAFGRHVSVAVIWMMTPDDGSSPGKKLGYLDADGRRGMIRSCSTGCARGSREGSRGMCG